MDAKITKKRLSHLLSYDWLKIVGLIVVAIIVWTLIFTMSATRITAAQQFTVVNYKGNNSFSATFSKHLQKTLNEDVFSYEVIETTTVDLPGSGEYASTILEARTSVAEGDVIFVADIEDTSVNYGEGEEKVYYTYLENFVRGYGYSLYNMDPASETSYFGEMKTYLNRYYTNGDYATGTLNEAQVRADFLARIEKNKDKRFKKKEQIEQGVKDDIARVEKYAAALQEFYGYYEQKLILPTETTVLNLETGEEVLKGIYSLNLCPATDPASPMSKLTEIASYERYYEEDGETKHVTTAENMNVALFDFDEVEEGFQYESLLYINAVIRHAISA